MKSFRIRMVPKKGGGISFAVMQASNKTVLWNIAQQAYPAFNILQIEEIK